MWNNRDHLFHSHNALLGSTYGNYTYIHFKLTWFNSSRLQMIWFSLFQGNEFELVDENVRVKQGKGEDVPYKVHTVGLYLVIESSNGLVLMWNKKTTVMIKLSSKFKVGQHIHGRLLSMTSVFTNWICSFPRENSAVFVGIMMGTSRMTSPPAMRKLWWKPLILETAGNCHPPALMQNHQKIPAAFTHTDTHGH